MKNWIYRALSRLRPDLTGIILFTLLWLVLIVAYGGKLHVVEGSILLPSYIAAGFLLIALFYHLKERALGAQVYPLESLSKKAKRILRDWLPVIYLGTERASKFAPRHIPFGCISAILNTEHVSQTCQLM